MNFKTAEARQGKREDTRKLCKYGSECYQKNPFHMAKFRHVKRKSDELDEKAAKKVRNDGFKERPETRSSSKESEATLCDSEEHLGENQSSGTLKDSDGNSEGKKVCSDENLEGKLHDISESSEDESEQQNVVISEATPGSSQTPTALQPNDIKSKLDELYVVIFPQDFYSFYDFCKFVYFRSPITALRDVGLALVGPYHFLSGDLTDCSPQEAIRHYRYFYDPPEFFTVLRSTDSDLHYGYFFDEVDKPPVCVASNNPSKSCIVKIEAPNLFGALNSHITNYIKTCDPFKKAKVQKLQASLCKWVKDKKVSVDLISQSLKQRNSKVNSKTFNEIGIVVPYDRKTDVGYRPLAENNKTLKDLLSKIKECDTESERNVRWNKIEHIITFACIAADECDFGTPLELAVDMFCMGHPCFHSTIVRLATMAYNLLGRSHFSTVIKVHLDNRLKGSNLHLANLRNEAN